MSQTVTPEYREAFFYRLVDRAFPGLRERSPSAFGDDVHVLYDFSLQHPHATQFNLQHQGAHGVQHHLAHAEHWLKAPRQSALYDALASGFTEQAAQDLQTSLQHGDMPSPIKGGKEVPADKTPSNVTLAGRTAKALPGAAAHDVANIASGAGGWLTKNPVILVIIVLVVVLVIKK